MSIKLLLASQAYETPAVIAAFLTEKQNTSDATGNCCATASAQRSPFPPCGAGVGEDLTREMDNNGGALRVRSQDLSHGAKEGQIGPGPGKKYTHATCRDLDA